MNAWGEKLYILDATALLFRAYHAIGQLTDDEGGSTQALYGFIRSVQKIIGNLSPKNLVAVFDGPDNKKARLAISKEYKSHRPRAPEDLIPQFQHALNYCRYAGIPHLAEAGVEADDVIGTVAKWGEKEGAEILICSTDKDLYQLISDRICALNTHKGYALVNREKVEAIYGVSPRQMVDYLAMTGDASDNIPGIPGIGPKTAASLLRRYGSLTDLFAQLEEMQDRKKRETLRQHKERAETNRRLVQLSLDIPLPLTRDFFQRREPNPANLYAFYQKMGFISLLKELLRDNPSLSKRGERSSYTIDDTASLNRCLEKVREGTHICIDLQADFSDPMRTTLFGIGLGLPPKSAWYIPTNGELSSATLLASIKSLLENPRIDFYGYDLKKIWHILKNHGIAIHRVGFDIALASYVLNPQKRDPPLEQLLLENLTAPQIDITPETTDLPNARIGERICRQIAETHRLQVILEEKIAKRNLKKILYEIELPLVPVLVDMERTGIYVDATHLQNSAKKIGDLLTKKEGEIHSLAGREFNIKSPKQLADVLFVTLGIKRKTKTPSTRAAILEELRTSHPIVEKVLEFRTLEKLRSTYLEALPQKIHPKTKRIHCSFMQSITATGRLSCQNPNLQNIPVRTAEGQEIRAAFKPEHPDWRYLAADYSQIELRLLAHFSEDPTLLASFERGEDVHAATAAVLFDTPQKEVSHAMRSQAKAVNFGILYGQQAFSLAHALGIEVERASNLIKRYFEKYSKVRLFFEKCKRRTRESGIAFTMMGRQRPIPEIKSANGAMRAAAERLAINTPLQGSQADIIKQAMIQIHEALEKNRLGSMILQIHDELLFELPEKNVESAKKCVSNIMEKVVPLKIPLVVNMKIGRNWKEC